MDEREALLRYLGATDELARRKKQAPLLTWAPHKGQQRMLDMVEQFRVTIANAGNRWGKSDANAVLTLSHAYGYWIHKVPNLKLTPEGDYPPRNEIDPKYWVLRPDGIPLRMPNVGLLVTGLKMERGIGQILFPKLWEALPLQPKTAGKINVSRAGSPSVPVRMILPNGSVVYFGSAEQDPMQFEGTAYDYMGFDEPPPRPIYQAAWRGCTDFYARVWMSMTPIGKNSPWIYHELVNDPERDDVAAIQGSIWDNPHISDDAKRAFLEGGAFNDEERRAREHGAWVFLSHVAFPQYEPNVHIIPTRQVDEGWIRGLAVDPHHRRPYAMIWAAFGPNGEVEVYNESPLGVMHHQMRSSGNTVRDYATIIRNMEGRLPADFRVLDPRFGKAEYSIKGQVTSSVQVDFAEQGLFFDFPRDGIAREETGILRLRDLLSYDKTQELSPTNQPKLKIQEHCINTIETFARSNFMPPDIRNPDVLPEKLKEYLKDFRDTARYLVLADRPWQRDGADGLGHITEEDLLADNDPYSL